jgi:hypothetical protein
MSPTQIIHTKVCHNTVTHCCLHPRGDCQSRDEHPVQPLLHKHGVTVPYQDILDEKLSKEDSAWQLRITVLVAREAYKQEIIRLKRSAKDAAGRAKHKDAKSELSTQKKEMQRKRKVLKAEVEKAETRLLQALLDIQLLNRVDTEKAEVADVVAQRNTSLENPPCEELLAERVLEQVMPTTPLGPSIPPSSLGKRARSSSQEPPSSPNKRLRKDIDLPAETSMEHDHSSVKDDTGITEGLAVQSSKRTPAEDAIVSSVRSSSSSDASMQSFRTTSLHNITTQPVLLANDAKTMLPPHPDALMVSASRGMSHGEALPPNLTLASKLSGAIDETR